jgi:hypothetical protein
MFYAHATDSIVRERLRPADLAISEGRIAYAARITRTCETTGVQLIPRRWADERSMNQHG